MVRRWSWLSVGLLFSFGMSEIPRGQVLVCAARVPTSNVLALRTDDCVLFVFGGCRTGVVGVHSRDSVQLRGRNSFVDGGAKP